MIGERPRWKEVLASRKTFTGKKGYKLTDPTGRWTEEKDDDAVTAHDPAADMVLFATDPKNKLRPAVYLVVMSLPKAEDPVEVHRSAYGAGSSEETRCGMRSANCGKKSRC